MKNKSERRAFGMAGLLAAMTIGLFTVACSSDDDEDNAVTPTATTDGVRGSGTPTADPKLVKVTYRKDCQVWLADDIEEWIWQGIVYRDRLYETGEVFTDIFNTNRYIMFTLGMHLWPATQDDGAVFVNEDGRVMVWGPLHFIYQKYPEYYKTISRTIGVPNLSAVAYSGVPYSYDAPCRLLNNYTAEQITIDAQSYITNYENCQLNLDGVEVVGSSGTSDKPSNWYLNDHSTWTTTSGFLYIDEDGWPDGTAMHWQLYTELEDAYLVMDGQLIDLREFWGTVTHDATESHITMPNGAPGKVFRRIMTNTVCGQTFTAVAVDTIYQLSQAEQDAALARLSQGSQSNN